MDQQNNGKTGAPSTDTTSALFVSARKKQLEQQEVERQAKEREAERLAAEAEVRRLEQEVAERKRRAQEEAERVEQEAAIRRQESQQAEQEAARARAAQPTAYAAPRQGGAQKAKPSLPVNKWVLIGGGAVLLLAVILIVALSGGGGSSVSAENFTGEISSVDGLSISYPDTWSGDMLTNNGAGLYLQGDDGLTVLAVMDVTNQLDSAVAGGIDAVTAAEGLLYDVAGIFASGSPVSDMEPQLIKSGASVQGSAGFRYQDGGTDMQGVVKIESIAGARTVMTAYAIPEGKEADRQANVCEAIVGTLMIGDPGDNEAYGAEAEMPYWETDARFMLYSDEQTGIQAYISTELEGQDNVILIGDDVPFSGVSFGDKLMLIDFTSLYRAMMEQGGSLTEVAEIYLNLMQEANGESLDNIFVGEPTADAIGMRIDFSFDMEGANICALRLFEAEDICMIAVGHALGAEAQEYFYVMAESMCVAVG